MDIGSSIAVFLVLSLVLLALFCFLTKYFHHKLKQTLQETAQIYSMVDELSVHENIDQVSIDLNEPRHKENEITVTPKSKNKKNQRKNEDQMFVEMTDLKRPINSKDNDIYGAGILKQKLNEQYRPLTQLYTGRSMASLKDFKPDRMNNTNRTAKSNEGQLLSTFRDNNNSHSKMIDDVSELPKRVHSFINKIVCYDSQEINILEVEVISIKQLDSGEIKQNKKVKAELILSTDAQFQDQLEIYGFEKEEFGCYKYETTLELEEVMEVGKEYMVSSLKYNETKTSIQIQDYIRYKFQLRGSM